jgi:hypothetical protein
LLADLPQKFRDKFSKVIRNYSFDEVQENRVFVGIKLTQKAVTRLEKHEQQHVRNPCSRIGTLLLALVPVLWRCGESA